MSEFEALSLVVACLALVVSLVVWAGQRRLQREANDLQRATADLSKRQLWLIEQQEQANAKAELSVNLVEESKGNHWLVVRNLGPAEARMVELRSLGDSIEDALLDKKEVAAKFPVWRLRATEEVRLRAAVYLASPLAFKIELAWTDGANQNYREEIAVAL